MPNLDEVLILPGKGKSQLQKSSSGTLGQVRVTQFDLNSLTALANVSAKDGAWLVYADAYHPGWKAYVNGTKTPIERAYLAFKAIKLPHGQSVVRFVFYDPVMTPLSYLTYCFCAVFAVALLVGFSRTLLKKDSS